MTTPKPKREERLEKAVRLAQQALRGELSPAIAEKALNDVLEPDDDLDAHYSCLGRLN